MGNSEASPKTNRQNRISRISALHCGKLVFRSILFLLAGMDYLLHCLKHTHESYFSRSHTVIWIVWFVFAVEMALRFFPGKFESMGCQKQFLRNYRPSGKKLSGKKQDRSRMWVAFVWIALNGIIAVLYYAGWIDKGILFLISLAYSVCDMICILFFCPFQTWFMKNKCCGTCRIYNWDYAMMFTPLLFVGGFWAWSLLALSLGLLVRWELTYKFHPERFYECTNQSLSCANCQEKLCQHKKQLQKLLQNKVEKYTGRD